MTGTWAVAANAVLDHFEKTKKIPKKYKPLKRYAYCGQMIICCGPCCLWSTIWRCVACPFMCCCKGPGFMCSNNGCTTITDKCIETAWTEKESMLYLGKVDAIDQETLNVLTRIKNILETKPRFVVENYKLCECLFMGTLGNSCAPFECLIYINKILE